jgi:hypothetical protein
MFQANKLKNVFLPLCALALLGACSVSTHDRGNGEDKKVDIKTPFAEIHVGSDTGAQDAGISLYPGAHAKSDEHDKHRANVQIGGEDFGVKVVAATYSTDDPPQKVIDFYRKDLRRYGNVLECPKGLKENHDKDSSELRCDDKGSEEPGKLDLAVGIRERQHIVSVKPDGKGTEFSTVFVQVRGGKGKGNETM